MKTNGFLTPVFILGFLASSTANADCTKFTLTSDPSSRSIQFVDAGNGGPGDMRIGTRIVDMDGSRKGTKHWVGKILGAGEDAPALFERVWLLDDGEIHARQMTGVVRSPNETAAPSIGDGKAVIIGGSGGYAGATGHVEIDLEGTSVSYYFDIQCQ